MSASTLANTGKVQSMLGDLRKLPLLPATAQQAMALANDDNSQLQEFTRLVEKDVTLASSILRLANSPIFSWGRSIESLSQAVVRLGLRECQNLMMAVSMGNLFQQSDPRTRGFCAVLWKHCFMTACLSRRVNNELHFDYQGEEFTAGLLHDLGRILLAVTMPDVFPQADPLDFVEAEGLLEREYALLHTDHCQLGTAYAEQNRLPASAIAAIRYHHHPADAKDHRGVIGLVAVADHMANFIQRGEDPNEYKLDESLGYQSLARGWTPEKCAAFKKLIPTVLIEVNTVVTDESKAAAPIRRAAAPRVAPPEEKDAPSVWGKMRSWFGS